MSREIEGPLTEVEQWGERLSGFRFESTIRNCPVCANEERVGRVLYVVGADFYGGIVSGVTWLLRCSEHHYFEWTSAVDHSDEVPE